MYLKKFGILFKCQFLSICRDAARSSVGHYNQPTTAAVVVVTPVHVNLRRRGWPDGVPQPALSYLHAAAVVDHLHKP